MRIYLDNCCFNRPFDVQSQVRVRLETEAKLNIQECIKAEKFELIWSYILDYENDQNPYPERQKTIARWRDIATEEIEESPEILVDAGELIKANLKPKDALHIACAIAGKCSHLITTDDTIIRKGKGERRLIITDPTAFVREFFV